MPSEYIVTVMSKDRVGIVADASRALAGLGGNITDLSQTLLRGYFTLIISVEMPETVTAERIKAEVAGSGAPGELGVEAKPFEPSAEVAAPEAERFFLTTRGADRPGIIARVTSHLCDRNINIEDSFAHVVQGDLLMIFQVAIPKGLNVHDVQREIEDVGREFGLTVHLQHENVFRATTEVRAVRNLRD